MHEPFDPRERDDAPSELTLDAYVSDEATPAEVEAVEAWIAADPAHAAIVEARRRGFDALPGVNPQAMLARIRLGLEAEARAPARAPAAPTRTRAAVTRWLIGGLAVAAVAAALLFFALRGGAPALAPPEDRLLTKGGLTLEVFRARGEAVTRLLPGDEATAGDRLRFKAHNVPPGPGQLMVVGVEASGAVFPYYPADGRSTAAHGALGADGALPGAAELDDSVGAERVWLVWCPRPFALAELVPGGDELKTPDTCAVDGLPIRKQ
ncbi:MAG: hypothetical protein R3F65_17805 [bacterium]